MAVPAAAIPTAKTATTICTHTKPACDLVRANKIANDGPSAKPATLATATAATRANVAALATAEPAPVPAVSCTPFRTVDELLAKTCHTCVVKQVSPSGDCGFLALNRASLPLRKVDIAAMLRLRKAIADDARGLVAGEIPVGKLVEILESCSPELDTLRAKFTASLMASNGRHDQHGPTAFRTREYAEFLRIRWHEYLNAVETMPARYAERRDGEYTCTATADMHGWLNWGALAPSAAAVLKSDVCSLALNAHNWDPVPSAVQLFFAKPKLKRGGGTKRWSKLASWATDLAPRLQWQSWLEAVAIGAHFEEDAQRIIEGIWESVRRGEWSRCEARLTELARGRQCEDQELRDTFRAYFADLLVEWLNALKDVQPPEKVPGEPPLIVLVHSGIHFSFVESRFRDDERFQAMSRCADRMKRMPS